MIEAPATSHLTLQNETDFLVMFIVRKGDMTIARTPAFPRGAILQVPTRQTYTVVAATVIEGNTYTSAPISVSGAAGFLARILQHGAQGTYAFDMQELPPRGADQMEFQTTTASPVTFTISNNGAHLQSVIVKDAFKAFMLSLADTYALYGVINGVTTGAIQTANPDATITVRVGPGGAETGDFELVVA